MTGRTISNFAKDVMCIHWGHPLLGTFPVDSFIMESCCLLFNLWGIFFFCNIQFSLLSVILPTSLTNSKCIQIPFKSPSSINISQNLILKVQMKIFYTLFFWRYFSNILPVYPSLSSTLSDSNKRLLCNLVPSPW